MTSINDRLYRIQNLTVAESEINNTKTLGKGIICSIDDLIYILGREKSLFINHGIVSFKSQQGSIINLKELDNY